MTLDTEVSSLKQVPLFREVEPARLKLLAFTSERVHFEPGQRFFARGDVALDRAQLLARTPWWGRWAS
jgi:CRP-like cAMP-binding protein